MVNAGLTVNQSNRISDDDRFVHFLNEHDCLVLVDENAVFQMPAHGASEHDLLQVAAFVHHVLDCVAMGNAHHVLLDDWSFVQGGGDVMAGGPDQLYAALEGLMIGVRPDERG